MKAWRINLILLFLFLFGAVIICRLFYIQVSKHEYWKALAKGQQMLFSDIPANRGEIYLRDKNGKLYPLAVNKEWPLVYVVPNEILAKEETAQKIGDILGVAKEEVLQKLSKESLYEVVKRRLSEEEVEKIKNLKISGIYFEKEKGRYYPQIYLTSQVVGFLGAEGLGQYGLEGFYDDILRGEAGFQEGERSAEGFSLGFSQKLSPAEEGADLILTIDYNIQFKAEKLLEQAKKDLEIRGGTIIVGDPATGEILALANYPNFDPNSYKEIKDLDVFQNPAVQKIFEPGSAFKPFVMAAGLNEKKITPDTTYTDTGAVKIGGHTINNFAKKTFGQRTMTEVLEKSINTGAVFAEQQVGNVLFLKYLEKFGIFELTGVDLAGEVSSDNNELKKGYEINFATASFGQGVEMTPFQLFRAFSAIANKGKLTKPHIVKKFISQEGEKENISEGSRSQVISQETAFELTKMLVSVVDKGYAQKAKIPGYYLGGKTGTAQVPWTSLGIQKSGYSDETIQSFLGFGPAFSPRFVVLIKLDNPSATTAEYSAVPIFHDLAQYIIDYYQIPPDYETESAE